VLTSGPEPTSGPVDTDGPGPLSVLVSPVGGSAAGKRMVPEGVITYPDAGGMTTNSGAPAAEAGASSDPLMGGSCAAAWKAKTEIRAAIERIMFVLLSSG